MLTALGDHPVVRLCLRLVALCLLALLAPLAALAQSLAGEWELLARPSLDAKAIGTMSLSSQGAVDFNGGPAQWQPNSHQVQFRVVGKLQLPVNEVNLEWDGTLLRGTMRVHSYQRQGDTLVPTGQQLIPIYARRQGSATASSSRAETSSTSADSGAQAANRPSTAVPPSSAPARPAPADKSALAGEPDAASATSRNTTEANARQGPIQLEAVALCWQNSRNAAKYGCDGPTQKLLMSDYTLDEALRMVGCESPRGTDGSRQVQGRDMVMYLCGHGLMSYDRDVAVRNGISVQRNQYRCDRSQHATHHCRDNPMQAR